MTNKKYFISKVKEVSYFPCQPAASGLLQGGELESQGHPCPELGTVSSGSRSEPAGRGCHTHETEGRSVSWAQDGLRSKSHKDCLLDIYTISCPNNNSPVCKMGSLHYPQEAASGIRVMNANLLLQLISTTQRMLSKWLLLCLSP